MWNCCSLSTGVLYKMPYSYMNEENQLEVDIMRIYVPYMLLGTYLPTSTYVTIQ